MAWNIILIVYTIIAFVAFCFNLHLSKHSYYPIKAFADSLLVALFWIFIFGDELIEHTLSITRICLRGRGV